MDVKLIECNKIDVPKSNNELRSFSKEFAIKLADSIKVEGLYNPIAVRPNPAAPGRFLLVQGKHRLYAKKNVLKEQMIECNVLADMDDAEAEMALIAENLWRNPLTKAQHALAIKKWFEHFLAKSPEKVGKGKAGSLAAAKAREEKKSAESEPKGETAAAEADGSEVRTEEDSFTAKVAAATGQSESSAARTTRIARAFTEEQLEVFSQMSVSQTDMLTVAKIKDEARRGEVVNLIASGMEPADAVKEVMGKAAPTRDNGSGKAEAAAKEAAREEKAPSLTDDEWYDQYCGEKAALLGEPARFKADALLFRKLSDHRHAFRSKAKAAVKATAEAGTKGSFWSLVNRLMSVAHPKDWQLCTDCKGKGGEMVADHFTGPGATTFKKCAKCLGGGYLLKTEEYL